MTPALALKESQAPRELRWVPIDEAASAIGVSSRTLRHKCTTSLSPSMAVKKPSSDGGQSKWFIREDCDPLLIADADPNHIPLDLSRYTDRQRHRALAKLACVKRLSEMIQSAKLPVAAIYAAVMAFARVEYPVLGDFKERTLRSWFDSYDRPGDVKKLVDNRGGDQRSQGDAAAWLMFDGIYLHQHKLGIKHCWKIVRKAALHSDWKWCGYDSCREQLKKRIPYEVRLFNRDPAKHRTAFAPFIKQDPEAFPAGECYIFDHKQLDVWVWFGGQKIRPWLTVAMDWRTRKIVGWVMCDVPNSHTFLACLANCLRDPTNFGGAGFIQIDNGKDFAAALFHGQTRKERRENIRPDVDAKGHTGLLHHLGIKAMFANPYSPNSKSRLEHWFRMLEQPCKTFETYAGMSVETRPDRLADILASGRKVPMFGAVYERVEQFIKDYNADAEHAMDDLVEGGVRLSPGEAFARWHQTERRMADPASLDLLMAHWHRPLPVTRMGVAVPIHGKVYHYGMDDLALMPFKGPVKDRRLVNVAYDPDDIRFIRVHDEKWRFVATVKMNRLGGYRGNDPIRASEVREIIRAQAKYKKALRHRSEFSPTQQFCYSPEEQLAEHAARKRLALPAPATSPTIKITHTVLDGQAAQIESREQRKVVGGSEDHFSFRKLMASINREEEGEIDKPKEMTLVEAMRQYTRDPEQVECERLEEEASDPFETIRRLRRESEEGSKSPMSKAIEVLNK